MAHRPPFTPMFPHWQPKLAALKPRAIPAVRGLRQATLSQIEERLSAAVPQKLLLQNPSKDHSRERIFTLSRTVWCWIWQIFQANTSCREVVRQVQAIFAIHDAGQIDEYTGAYCVARRKLGLPLLQALFAATVKSAETAAKSIAPVLLNGRPLRVFDGSGVQLQDTPANRAAYPPSKNMKEGTGFPFLRIGILFCLASGAVLAHATGSLHVSELRLWLDLLPRLNRGDIVLGDRAYGLYVVAALLQKAGVDLIATLPSRSRKVDFRKVTKRIARNDALFVWTKSKKCSALLSPSQWAALPQEITVRVIRMQIQRRGHRPASLDIATTLLDPEIYRAADIIQTHSRRWRLEMTLDDIKTTLGMKSLSCRSPEMIHKELLVFLAAHNFIRWIMLSAAAQENVPIDRLSFKGSLDAFRQWGQAMAACTRKTQHRLDLWRKLLRAVASDQLPLRPGRSEPRAVKTRSKYPHLNQPRSLYIGRASRNKRRRIHTAKKHRSTN